MIRAARRVATAGTGRAVRSAVSRSPAWHVFGDTARGAAHLRNDKPNQDFWAFRRDPGDRGRNVLLAMADGHGGARSFRSAKGAELAVAAATEVLWPNRRQAYRDLRDPEPHRLATMIVRSWRESVARDIVLCPFSTEELVCAGPDDMPRDQAGYLAYGATLLAVVAATDAILYLQLGDGEILTVSERGIVESPLGKDNSLLGVETTSLCQEHAVDNVRFAVHAVQDRWPALILLTTDGLPTSYEDDAGFRKFARDLVDVLHEHGRQHVQQNLYSVLRNASDHGSGDDISVAIAYRRAGIRGAAMSGTGKGRRRTGRNGRSAVEDLVSQGGDGQDRSS